MNEIVLFFFKLVVYVFYDLNYLIKTIYPQTVLRKSTVCQSHQKVSSKNFEKLFVKNLSIQRQFGNITLKEILSDFLTH